MNGSQMNTIGCPPQAQPTLRDDLAQIEKRLIGILETLIVPYAYLDGDALISDPRCEVKNSYDAFHTIFTILNDISACATAIKNRVG